jgi:hypothetical protein
MLVAEVDLVTLMVQAADLVDQVAVVRALATQAQAPQVHQDWVVEQAAVLVTDSQARLAELEQLL